jgi:predicted RNase H-like HicB family nuclease
MMFFNAIIEKDDDGYFAYVPRLKGCVSQGDTYEEVLNNIKEAAEVYIDSLQGSELVSVQAQNTVIAPIEIMKHG